MLFCAEQGYRYCAILHRTFSKIYLNSKKAIDGPYKKKNKKISISFSNHHALSPFSPLPMLAFQVLSVTKASGHGTITSPPTAGLSSLFFERGGWETSLLKCL